MIFAVIIEDILDSGEFVLKMKDYYTADQISAPTTYGKAKEIAEAITKHGCWFGNKFIQGRYIQSVEIEEMENK
jgi:hypothetical protein